MLGFAATMLTIIKPAIPSGGITRKARGTPMQKVSRCIFISIFVSPSAIRRLPMLMVPRIVNKLVMTYNVRKKGAESHLLPYIVLIMGCDSTIMAIVAGAKNRAVYLTEAAKTVLRSWGSFRGSSFEKAGNRTVEMGTTKKVNRTAKLVAIL